MWSRLISSGYAALTSASPARTPRKLAIAGKSNHFLCQEVEYTADSLGKVSQVNVEIGNPMAQTVAGPHELEDEMVHLREALSAG